MRLLAEYGWIVAWILNVALAFLNFRTYEALLAARESSRALVKTAEEIVRSYGETTDRGARFKVNAAELARQREVTKP